MFQKSAPSQELVPPEQPPPETRPAGPGNSLMLDLLTGANADPSDPAAPRRGPLPYQGKMETLFGRDFADIEVLFVEESALARLHANAATDGQTIALSPRPTEREVAHELAHVVQGPGSGPGTTSRGEAAEREADAAADLVARGQPVGALKETPSAGTALDEWDTQPTIGVTPPTNGQNVGQLGIICWDGTPEVRLRATPSTEEDNVLGFLPFNTKLQIEQRVPGDWYWVSTLSGQRGYVAASLVWSAPEHPLPEPGARLHRVQSGETAIGIAEQYFGAEADDWGQDLRFYVNVLAAVNGIAVPDEASGWKEFQVQADTFLWIPTVSFAKGLVGQVNSGSLSYEALDSVGVAGALDRIEQLWDDFKTAISLSGPYIGDAVAAHAQEAILESLKALAIMAVGAAALLAISTAVGAAIGALAGGVGAAPGAAAGFEVGLALLEWLGLGFLILWLGSAAVRLGSAFGSFLAMVWEARGDQAKLDAAARQLAESMGVLVGVLIEALIMWAVSVGVSSAVGALKETPFGRAIGETRLGEWLGERVGNYNNGRSPVPGPREAFGSARLAEEFGITREEAATLARYFDEPTLRAMHEKVRGEGLTLSALANKDPAVLSAIQRALTSAGADGVARGEILESVRLNAKGSLSNDNLRLSLEDYAQFRTQYGERVMGDFVSRFRRARGGDQAQAQAEIQMARDLLEGRTVLGATEGVTALPESTVPGQRTPDLSARTPEGARLVEVKAIGQEGQPLTETGVKNNARSANQQIREYASISSGETGGLIRLDGRNAGNSNLDAQTLLTWIREKLPSPRNSRVTRWVEILFKDQAGDVQRVVLELVNGVFQIYSEGPL